MTVNFALTSSGTSLVMYHRTGDIWQRVRSVDLSASDYEQQLKELARHLQTLEPTDTNCKLVVPGTLVRYISLADVPEEINHDRIVRDVLGGATPYEIEELVCDRSEAGGAMFIAAVARETLAEAEEFACAHDFKPVYFCAAPDFGQFVGEPFFGVTQWAKDNLPKEQWPERAPCPVHEIRAPYQPHKTGATSDAAIAAGTVTGVVTETITEAEVETSADEETLPDEPVAETVTETVAESTSEPVAAPIAEPDPVVGSFSEPDITPDIAADTNIVASIGGLDDLDDFDDLDDLEDLVPEAPMTEAEIEDYLEETTGIAAAATHNTAPAPDQEPPARPAKRAALSLALPSLKIPSLKIPLRAASLGIPNSLRRPTALAAGLTAIVIAGYATFGTDGARVEVPDLPEAQLSADKTASASTPRLSEQPQDIAANGQLDVSPDTALNERPKSNTLVADMQPDRAAVLPQGSTSAHNVEVISGRPPAVPPLHTWRSDDTNTATQNNEQQGIVVASADITIIEGAPPAIPPAAFFSRQADVAGTDTPDTAVDADTSGVIEAALAAALEEPTGPRPVIRPQSVVTEAPEITEDPDNPLANARPERRPEEIQEMVSSQEETAAAEAAERAAAEQAEAEKEAAKQAAAQQTGQAQVASEPTPEPEAFAYQRMVKPMMRPRRVQRAAQQVFSSTGQRGSDRGDLLASNTSRESPSRSKVKVRRNEVMTPTSPTPRKVAGTATEKNAMRFSKVNLIGVFGSPRNRQALILLSNGKYQKVKVGDRLDGGKVSAISENTVSYVRSGRSYVLQMPRG